MSSILSITVGDPRQENSLRKKFVSYEIKTVISHPSLGPSQKRVVTCRRKYADFASTSKLYLQLISKPERRSFPRMPARKFFKRFTTSIAEERVVSFQRIVDYAVTMPTILGSSVFQEFVGVKGLLRKQILIDHMRCVHRREPEVETPPPPLSLDSPSLPAGEEFVDDEEEEGEVGPFDEKIYPEVSNRKRIRVFVKKCLDSVQWKHASFPERQTVVNEQLSSRIGGIEDRLGALDQRVINLETLLRSIVEKMS